MNILYEPIWALSRYFLTYSYQIYQIGLVLGGSSHIVNINRDHVMVPEKYRVSYSIVFCVGRSWIRVMIWPKLGSWSKNSWVRVKSCFQNKPGYKYYWFHIFFLKYLGHDPIFLALPNNVRLILKLYRMYKTKSATNFCLFEVESRCTRML